MKKLVAYYSASGVTKNVAELLAQAANADLYEIKPKVPYTAADLNWMDKKSRSTLEMKDKSSRPEIADRGAEIENYDTVFLGFPIWWYTAPTIVNTFLESYDFSGKTVVLFATSGGSRFGKTAKDLEVSAPKANVIEGKILNGRQDVESLRAWAEEVVG